MQLERYKVPLIIVLSGLSLLGAGILYMRAGASSDTKIEIIDASPSATIANNDLKVEVSGEVNNPAVYSLPFNSRVDDAIAKAGGLTNVANLEWIEKNINKAAKLLDGQKIYIPSLGEQTDVLSASSSWQGSGQNMNASGTNSSGNLMININSASQSQLEELWGIGPVTAQKIIEQRPYSEIGELLSKKIVKQNVYDAIKDQISIY